jgi:hypothetical protein
MNKSISHHHGSCDMCHRKYILVLMFGYDSQDKSCYSICQDCFSQNIYQIIYGFHQFEDGLTDFVPRPPMCKKHGVVHKVFRPYKSCYYAGD